MPIANYQLFAEIDNDRLLEGGIGIGSWPFNAGDKVLITFANFEFRRP